MAFFFKLFILLIIKRGGDAIITATGNKLANDAEGNFEDPFVDPLIQSGVIKKFLYIEYSSDLVKERKTKIKAHIRPVSRNIIVILMNRLYARKPEVQEKADFWTKKLNKYFKDNKSSIELTNDEVKSTFSSFFSRYKWYFFLWKILKPERLFCVDMIPDGALAAARSLNIKIYEFQHGFISHTKPDYIIDASFSACKKKW